jgi:predicted nucleic acid-binding protein
VLARQVPDPSDVPSVSRDPDDDYLVALVHSAGAEVLCSGDADLAAVTEVEVRSPRALLDRLHGETQR